MFRFWSQFLARLTRLSAKTAKRPPLRPARPGLELLEARTVPTVVFTPHFGVETVSDGGGAVLPDAPIYLIFNGSGWGTKASPSAAATAVENSLTNLLQSPYLSGLHQYR